MTSVKEKEHFSRSLRSKLSPEEMVKLYLRTHNIEPLRFGKVYFQWYMETPRFDEKHLEKTPITIPKNPSLEDAIDWAFYQSRHRKTYTSKLNYQCRPGARRSALDIYRILKFYYPGKWNIFDVMRKMSSMKISSSYCYVVKKRVFYTGSSTYDDVDEFGLMMRDWKRIGLENKDA